ncbi:tRNA adenosine(34) deaminase TadA [Candidatus Erwinia haradaeae]|uniref:tRNA-specific adenosine deaminase n=1 Tax=Candidatus Erwinia haradaeae TaxID=1922217 RepID=A0A451D2Q6_9GAMM|nr:tRNA adenosine(34) deaminase TadA [Candidatus Erwinia haradaeae]VFP79926.1 tRNA-specific adenosine deaminase [Candidatus Erwinia haradaeae]
MTNYPDEYWMKRAIFLATEAKHQGEVPIGAVLVLYDQVIGEGYNQSIGSNDPTAHAEIIALRRGGQTVKNYRLLQSTLYVTLEPCMMCIGAIICSRISRLVYGAYDTKISSAGSCLNFFLYPVVNHYVQITYGVLSEQCSSILNDFFSKKRAEQKLRKKNLCSFKDSLAAVGRKDA